MTHQDALIAKALYNDQFESFSGQQTAYPVLREFREKLHATYLKDISHKRLLFIGCGDGHECAGAIHQGASVTGIDISEKAVEFASKKYPEATFQVMDMAHLDFQGPSFDMIISLFSIMYIEPIVDVLINWKKVLQQGGHCLIAVPHPVRKMMRYSQGKYFVKGRQCEVWKGVERFGYYRLFEDYIRAFYAAGLTLIDMQEPEPVKENEMTQDSEVAYPHFLLFVLANEPSRI